MGILDDISKKLFETGQDAARGAKTLTETVRIRSQISDERKRISRYYTEIGAIYYANRNEENLEPDDEEVADLLVEESSEAMNEDVDSTITDKDPDSVEGEATETAVENPETEEAPKALTIEDYCKLIDESLTIIAGYEKALLQTPQ